LDDITIKIYEVAAEPSAIDRFPDHVVGEIVSITKNEVFVKVGDGLLALKTLQLAGKKPMDIKALMNGAGKKLLTVGKIFK